MITDYEDDAAQTDTARCPTGLFVADVTSVSKVVDYIAQQITLCHSVDFLFEHHVGKNYVIFHNRKLTTNKKMNKGRTNLGANVFVNAFQNLG